MKAIITVGISASGKSTWAAEKVNEAGSRWFIVCRDNIRWSVSGVTGWKDYKFNKKTEKEVTELQEAHIKFLAKDKCNIIIADTNLNPSTRNRLIDLCTSLGYEVEIKEFPITLEEAWKRDQFRGVFSVGRDVIYKQWQQWLEYKGEGYKPNSITNNGITPKAVIFDIDGTLAHMDGNRRAFEWDKVGMDSVDAHVKRMLKAYVCDDYAIIIVSGRDSSCRSQTEDWLYENRIYYDALLMRPKGDMRKDTIIKREIFDNYIRNEYNVEVVFDDRPSVVRTWYDIGIPKVIAVGNPWVEF